MRKQIESMTKAASSTNASKLTDGYIQTKSGIWMKNTAAIKANTQAKNANANATKKAADATNRLQLVRMLSQLEQKNILTH